MATILTFLQPNLRTTSGIGEITYYNRRLNHNTSIRYELFDSIYASFVSRFTIEGKINELFSTIRFNTIDDSKDLSDVPILTHHYYNKYNNDGDSIIDFISYEIDDSELNDLQNVLIDTGRITDKLFNETTGLIPTLTKDNKTDNEINIEDTYAPYFNFRSYGIPNGTTLEIHSRVDNEGIVKFITIPIYEIRTNETINETNEYNSNNFNIKEDRLLEYSCRDGVIYINSKSDGHYYIDKIYII